MKYKKGNFIVVPNVDILSGKPTEMQVLFFWICKYANEDGECFPSRKKLATDCGYSDRTVDKYLKVLIEQKFIQKTVRKKKNSKENMSNLYQIMEIDLEENVKQSQYPSETDVSTCGEPNDTVTIPNNNYNNLTIKEAEPLQKEEEIQEEEYDNEKDEIIIPTPKVTLSSNKTPVFRIVSVYGSFYRTLYGYNHKHNFAMMLKTFKPLLEMYSEIQIALLLGVMFDWHGMEGNNENESRWLQENCFPPSAFVKQINKYELYIRTKTDYHFEDDNILIGEFRDFVNEYKKIYG